MSFLPKPYPERFSRLSLRDPGKPQDMLSVGLQRITQSPDGLKIVPTKEVAFAIGNTTGNAEERVFSLPPQMARGLARRLLEFAEAAEEKD